MKKGSCKCVKGGRKLCRKPGGRVVFAGKCHKKSRRRESALLCSRSRPPGNTGGANSLF